MALLADTPLAYPIPLATARTSLRAKEVLLSRDGQNKLNDSFPLRVLRPTSPADAREELPVRVLSEQSRVISVLLEGQSLRRFHVVLRFKLIQKW